MKYIFPPFLPLPLSLSLSCSLPEILLNGQNRKNPRLTRMSLFRARGCSLGRIKSSVKIYLVLSMIF